MDCGSSATLAGRLATPTVDDALNSVYEAFQLLIPYDRLGYAAIDPGQGTAVAVWARSKQPGRVKLKTGFQAPLAGSSLIKVAATGKPRVINDLVDHLKSHPESHSTKLIVAEGIRSSLTCPITVDTRTIGFLFFSSARPNTYRDMDQQALVGLTKLVSSTISLELSVAHKENVNQLLAHQALQDSLTGLLNRRGLTNALVTWSGATPARRAVIVFDLDGFKQLNDAQGHNAGDQYLQQVARILAGSIRNSDHAARIGGDEFVVLLNEVGDSQRVTSRILQQIAESPTQGTASAGLATFNPADVSVETALKAADQAMYEAKRSGGNQAATTRTL